MTVMTVMTASEAQAILAALDALEDETGDAICFAELDGQHGWAVRIEHDGYVYRVVPDYRTAALRERLAALAHEQWSGWMIHLFGNAARTAEGAYVIPAPLVQRWERQIATPYARLPEDEKQSDRSEADRVLEQLAAGKD